MSDAPEDTAPPTPGSQAPVTPLRFLGQFIKDLSFEAPHAPEIFNILRQQAPAIPITIDANVRQLDGPVFEVTLTVHLEATVAEKTAFIFELLYGCVVELNPEAVPQEYAHSLLLIEVPRYMFPFVRQIVSETTGSAGFPPLLLQMVDFADLYRKKFADAQAAAADAPAAVH